MPIIEGVCIPPVCLEIDFDTTKATLTATKNGAKININPMLQGFIQQEYNDYLATLKNPVKLECDCCDCQMFPKQNPPPVAVPPHDLNKVVLGKDTYVVTVDGITSKVFWGVCVYKPAKKAGGAAPKKEEPEKKQPKKAIKKKRAKRA
jgi:hypothetical protein